jgi:uncharacterized protein (DUF433 family)
MSRENPSPPKIRLSLEQALEFIRDLKAGLSDAELAEKYALTPKSLLLHKNAVKEFIDQQKRATQPKPVLRIQAKDVLEDLGAGTSDEDMMSKYGLTRRQLQRLFRKMIRAGFLTPLQLANRLSITESQVYEAFEEAAKAKEEMEGK